MTYFIIYGAIAAAILLLPIVGVGPWVRHDRDRNRNTFAGVTMRAPAKVERSGQSFKGVLAQEISEYWMRWFVSFGIATPLLIFVTDHPLAMVLSPFAVGLLSIPFYAQLDLIGRAVEVIVADEDGYLEAEASRLQRGTTRNFASYSVEQVERMIVSRFWIANILVFLLQRTWTR